VRIPILSAVLCRLEHAAGDDERGVVYEVT
jgi:hypothetical protein